MWICGFHRLDRDLEDARFRGYLVFAWSRPSKSILIIPPEFMLPSPWVEVDASDRALRRPCMHLNCRTLRRCSSWAFSIWHLSCARVAFRMNAVNAAHCAHLRGSPVDMFSEVRAELLIIVIIEQFLNITLCIMFLSVIRFWLGAPKPTMITYNKNCY